MTIDKLNRIKSKLDSLDLKRNILYEDYIIEKIKILNLNSINFLSKRQIKLLEEVGYTISYNEYNDNCPYSSKTKENYDND